MSVEEDTILGEEPDGSGEHEPLHVPADFSQILRSRDVSDPGDLLLDDRAFI